MWIDVIYRRSYNAFLCHSGAVVQCVGKPRKLNEAALTVMAANALDNLYHLYWGI